MAIVKIAVSVRTQRPPVYLQTTHHTILFFDALYIHDFSHGSDGIVRGKPWQVRLVYSLFVLPRQCFIGKACPGMFADIPELTAPSVTVEKWELTGFSSW